jgi:lipopolysaccharide biosynthesis glycosyltransferase
MPLATALRSLAEANRARWPLDVHVLESGFSEPLQRRVRDSLPTGAVSIQWITVDVQQFEEFSTIEHISKVTFARLLIPRVFPQAVRRILYLDADMLILDDLGELFATDLGAHVVGAVADHLDTEIKEHLPGTEGAPRVASYFNAGVLLIDLERWREERISELALDYLRTNPRTPFSDQDALNVACDRRWKGLNPRWNFIDFYRTARIADMDAQSRPAIVHFATCYKPWNYSYSNVNAPFYDTFRGRTLFGRKLVDRQSDGLKTNWNGLKRLARAALGESRTEKSK